MTTMSYFYCLSQYFVLSQALVFTMRNYQTTNAIEVASNFTSTICSANKSCVTMVCINDEPCRSITSILSGIQQDNSTEENKDEIISPNFPLRII
jgi:hypothetical protein